MYKHGKKVDLTKKYTLQEWKKLQVDNYVADNMQLGLTLAHIALMAYIDLEGKERAADFVALYEKYCEDYDHKDFKAKDVREYIKDIVKGE